MVLHSNNAQPSPDGKPLDFLRAQPLWLADYAEAMALSGRKTETALKFARSSALRGMHEHAETHGHLARSLSVDVPNYEFVIDGNQCRHQGKNDSGDKMRTILRRGEVFEGYVRLSRKLGKLSQQFIREQGKSAYSSQQRMFVEEDYTPDAVYKELIAVIDRRIVKGIDGSITVERNYYIVYPVGFAENVRDVFYADRIKLERGDYVRLSEEFEERTNDGTISFDPQIEERDEEDDGEEDGQIPPR